MFYFIPTIYTPSTAASIRAISYIKGFSELGVETTVVYFQSDKEFSRFEPELPHIRYKFYWKKIDITNKLIKYLSLICYYIHFISQLQSDDTVFVYSDSVLWYQIQKFKPQIRIFLEHTEKPEVVGIGVKFLTPSWKNYYKAVPRLSGLFVISTALKEHFTLKGVPNEKIYITNISVDPHRFEGIKKSSTDKYIAYCGHASNNKDGVDQLIKAFAIVASEIPDVSLYILGEIPKEDKSGNLQLIQRLGLRDRVKLVGIVSYSDMPQYLKNAQVLVLARPDNIQAKYGFATKLGEYLLSKNPVVVTRVGDFDLFLSDNESVLFSQPDNISEFAQKIIWVFEHPQESKKIGEKGYAVAMENFTYLSVTESIVNKMNV